MKALKHARAMVLIFLPQFPFMWFPLKYDHFLLSHWQGNSNKEIPVCPDYIEYDDKHCTECVLIFSSSCIRMKGSTDQGTLSFQRGLDDIVDIESLWFGRVNSQLRIYDILD